MEPSANGSAKTVCEKRINVSTRRVAAKNEAGEWFSGGSEGITGETAPPLSLLPSVGIRPPGGIICDRGSRRATAVVGIATTSAAGGGVHDACPPPAASSAASRSRAPASNGVPWANVMRSNRGRSSRRRNAAGVSFGAVQYFFGNGTKS